MLGEEVYNYNEGVVSLRVLDRCSSKEDWRQTLKIQQEKAPDIDKVYIQIEIDLESKEKKFPTALILYIRSQLVGFLLLDIYEVLTNESRIGYRWRMLQIYVDPDFQEKGFGGFLFDYALRYINRGANELGYFEVDPDFLPVRRMLIRRGVTLPKDKRDIIPTTGRPLTDAEIRSFRGFPVNLAPQEWQHFPLEE